MIERLVQGYLGAIKTSVRDEFRFLKRKYHEDVQTVIDEQREAYEENILRHSRNFERHYAHLQERGLIGRENHKQDVIAHFFTDHDKQFHKILHNQEKSLNCRPLADRVRRMTHRTTQDYLLQEEQLYSELLTLVHTKTEKIDLIARKLRLDERYDAVTKNALTVTLASEALLLGPLEVLSIPLWGAYFGLKEIRDHHKHFEQWRRIRKHRIQ